MTDSLEQHVEHGAALIITNGIILQHLDFVRHWRLVDLSCFDQIVYGSQDMLERERDIPGRARAAHVPPPPAPEVLYDIHELARENKVYYVGTEKVLRELEGSYFNHEHFKIVARVDLPRPPKTLAAHRFRLRETLGEDELVIAEWKDYYLPDD